MSPPETKRPEQQELEPKQELKREIIEFIKMVAWFLILIVLLRTYVIEGYEVQGVSMDPTLRDNERILVLKLPHYLSRFSLLSRIDSIKEKDIIVFKSATDPNKRYVKRVVARGPQKRRGKTVAAQHQTTAPYQEETVPVTIEEGRVFVNYRRIHEDYINPGENGPKASSREIRLKPGAYFVLGDNRNISKDSRSFGPVDGDQIIGKAVLRFWPLTRFSLL